MPRYEDFKFAFVGARDAGPGARPMPDGSALAVQMSYHIDFNELLTRKY